MKSPVYETGPARSLARAGEAGDGTSVPPMSLHCLMCGGRQHRVVFTEQGIDILRCKSCGHVFSSFRAVPHYAEYWGSDVPAGEHYYWSRARARMHGDFFERFIAGRSGRLLDMGSGLGFFVKAMARFQDWDAFGCEISPAAVRHAREHLGLQTVICTPLQDADLPRASFDIITMWDVLDHIPHPDPLLSHCHALLKDDGMLFLRTPNVATQLFRARIMRLVLGDQPDRKYLQASDHAHHYSARSLAALLKRNGFASADFTHLHPIAGESGTGWRRALVGPVKNMGYQVVRGLAFCSGGHLNFDNLFVVARKGVAAPSP